MNDLELLSLDRYAPTEDEAGVFVIDLPAPQSPCSLGHGDHADLVAQKVMWCVCGWEASPGEIEAGAQRAEQRLEQAIAQQSRDLGALWVSASRGEMRGLERIDGKSGPPQASSPRWATPISDLDYATNGGIYGITGLRGSAKSGKSMFALLLALLAAARDEMLVVYVAAEMTRDQILGRLGWLANEHGITPAQLDEAIDERLVIFSSRGTFAWEDFTEFVASALYGWTSALVIIDSINTLLADMDGGGDYWNRYRAVLRTLIGVRKRTEGAFAALVLSEHNKQRASKGEQLEYAADLMLDFQQTKMPRVVKISVVGTRELGQDGPLGEYRMTPFATYERVRGEA